MVRANLGLALILALLGPTARAADETPSADPERTTAQALGRAGLPWYDPAKDAARPIRLPSRGDDAPAGSTRWSRFLDWLGSGSGSAASEGRGSGIGGSIGPILFGLGLVALVGGLIWLYRQFDPFAGSREMPTLTRPNVEVADVLPEGFDAADPLAEAIRRRASGDLGGAIICLFAHQMLTLSRIGLVRLAPGRTGRQLVRGVADAGLRDLVRPTLGLFEAAYYGRIPPDPEAFAAAWARAEAFERLVAARGAG